MIPAIQELNFPKIDGKQYATLSHATVNLADMGEKTISTQVKINGDITPDFSRDWEVEFQGEKYIMPLRQPQGAKENTSLNSTIDLTFQHWAIYQLKRWMFFTVQPVETGTAVADKYIADVILNLGDFCNLFGQVLRHYYGDTITIDLNPNWDYKQEAVPVSINHSYIWDVLIKFHELFAVRWSIEPDGDSSHYVIKVGYPAEELDHIFEYGFDGGLLKVERQVQSEDIRNMLLGRGGEKNIPKYYFKKSPDEKKWRSDPDWIEELANIYFTNLMGATFRSYVQGWKAAHISKYPGYAAVGESNAYAPWAYRKGYTDSKFDPVEYVKDDESIAKYGPLLGGLDNNEEIYPSMQGSGMDVAVDVEQIKSDDVADSAENDAQIEDKTFPNIIKRNVPQGHATASDANKRTYFAVLTGKKANIEGYAGAKAYNPKNNEDKSVFITELDSTIKVFNATTGEQHSASGIPAGDWYFTVEYSFNNTSPDDLNVTLSFNSVKITSATPEDKWRNTFEIWVKNIWETSKLSTETNEEYAERVWKPILGDREQNTAKVTFTTGALAISEDYEFTIVDFPQLDTSKSFGGESSHWRIKLAKSDADLESTGLYVPSTQKQGKAGDKFVFIGTEMTHHYVVWAEKALDDWKKDQLREKKDIKPTWVVTTDRVRLNNEGKANALIQKLRIGNSLRLADKRFIEGDYETLYLQSITYTYREPSSDDAALNPDVAIVLSNEYATTANPVATMQGEISALQRQVGSRSNVEQIVRAVGDRLYLRKDGISDRSLSPTQFFSLLTSGDFRSGIIGGAGWGFFKDENENWVLEADRVNVRQEMQVNTLVINQAEGRGGMEIDTAAFMEVTRVVETSDSYVCYFDQKEGSVANLFHVDDVAYCNRWTPENTELKFYKRRVTAIGVDNITLSKTDVNGSGIPAEKDNIIHFGNYTDKTRQYVKVRDVVGGGYERYIEELNSVNAAGVEYYFVGKQSGKSRWFVGNKDLVPYSGKGDGSYIEYINRRFNLNNVTLSVNTTIGDQSLADYIQQVSPPVKQEDIEGFVDAIVDPKIEGIQNQIDGVIETWFYNGVPTLRNYPADGWTTAALKIQHLGDLYYDNDTGTAYRFSQNAQGGYYWNTITDDAITKALAAAKAAQDTADGKRRVFTSQPAPPYDEGDLWVNATYPVGITAATRDPYNSRYYRDILRCGTAKTSGSFAISDWGLASNYTDDTKANEALSSIRTYEYIKNALAQDTQISGGLMMTTLISLGYTDEGNMRHTLAGMNGAWIDDKGGRTIAAWYGGDMIDAFDYRDTLTGIITLPPDIRAATSLFRMDGTGYLSKGSLWWDDVGNLFLGSGITVSGDGYNATLASILNAFNGLNALLVPIDGKGQELDWTNAVDAVALKARKNFCTEGELSVLGWQSGNEPGVGLVAALSDLTDVKLTGLAAGDLIRWDGKNWVNVKASELGIGGSVDLTAYLKVNGSNATNLGVSAMIRALSPASAALTDATLIVTSEDTGQTDVKPNYYRRSAPAFWAYIQGKSDNRYITALGVNGNYLTWTKNGMANNITVPYATYSRALNGIYTGSGGFKGPSYFVGKGLAVNMMNVPETYCDIIYINGYNSSGGSGYDVPGINALAFRKTTGDHGSVWHTSASHGSSNWGTWHKFLDTYNYASTLDARYVKKAGDEMSGKLTAPSILLLPTFSSTDSWIQAFCMRADVIAGKQVYYNFGVADGLNNSANINFHYAGDRSTSNYIGFGFASNNNLAVLLASGSVLIGTTTNSSGAKLHVAGTIYSTQEITALSDRRVKSDIRTLPFRGALIPRTYIKDGRPSIGFIAQEVNELYPELVNKGATPDALWSLNYQAITAVLAAQIGVHKDEIAKLRRRMAQVENELKNYRSA